jgi:hypothetical protein
MLLIVRKRAVSSRGTKIPVAVGRVKEVAAGIALCAAECTSSGPMPRTIGDDREYPLAGDRSSLQLPRLLACSALVQAEIERGAFLGLRLGPDVAAVPLQDALDHCQTYSRSLEIFCSMETLENTE